MGNDRVMATVGVTVVEVRLLHVAAGWLCAASSHGSVADGTRFTVTSGSNG